MGVHVVEVHRVAVVGGGGAVVVRLPAVAETGVVVEQDLVAEDVLPPKQGLITALVKYKRFG